MGRIVGIDLGTTNTAVAVISDGRPRVIEDDRGYKVLPSVISARGEGRFVVGQAAHNLILTHPDRTVYATKRLIGRRWDSPEVQRARERLQFQLREAPDGGVQVRVGEEWMTPAEVAAVVLQVARTVTERALGEAVDEAVITVPAHFTHHQRQQTLEAARLAGLKCERLLNEPTAAALAYGHRKNIERTVAIFDLGGGTFDVTVLKLSHGVYEVLSTSGDTYLGGEDFDYRIVDHLADALQAKSGADVRNDRTALQRLKDAAERAKCDLSFSDRTNVVIPHIVQGHSLEVVLTRTTLESLTGDLVQRCVDVTRQAVAEADLQLSDIDEVILVGGQTRMPRVREAVSGLFGREPSRSVHPEEAVAVGAAVHAAALSDPGLPQTVLLDVTPFDLGIDAMGGIFSVIVPRNSRVPAAESRTFATVSEGQTTVRITVRQGESRIASENEFLGEFVLEGLRPAARMGNKLDVNFRLDANGILHVAAIDRATKEKKNISVRNYAERAREPRLPSDAEVEADRLARLALDSATVTPVAAPSAGTAQKAGLLASLFGIGKKKKVATPAAAPAPAPLGPMPSIDLAAVPLNDEDSVELDREAVEPIAEEDAAMATYVEEEELYARDDSAALGLGGGRIPGGSNLRSGASAPEIRSPSGLDAGALFDGFGPEEPSDDPSTESRRGGPGDAFGGDPFASASSADPFASSFGASIPDDDDPFGSPGEDTGEAVLAQTTGIGEDPPRDTPAIAAPMWTPDSTPATPKISAPMMIDSPVPDQPAADDEIPLFLGGGEADPFGTGDGGAAIGLSADMFADVGSGEEFGVSLADGAIEDATGVSLSEGTLEDTRDVMLTDGSLEDAKDIALVEGGAFGGTAPTATPRPAVKPKRPEPAQPAAPIEMTLGGGAPEPPKKKKPARLKLQYRERDAFVQEYRENLRRGSSFIRTDRPLAVGRECVFEIEAPGLVEPLQFDGVVSTIKDGSDGEEAGMYVDYRMDEETRFRVEIALET